MASDRMFHVIVVGGVALAGAVAMSATTAACGGDVATQGQGNSSDASSEEFPSELGAPAPDASPFDASALPDAFPQEGPAMIDSGVDAADASSDATAEADSFPQEGPIMIDGGGIE